ncbi:MAG: beta-galactosidase [Opitutaceae bacterium]|nr:beta-galactosidase [Opitutaceae bacterium]
MPSSPPASRRFFHGVAYYPELWPEGDVTRDIAEMRRAGISVVRMGDFAWSKMEPDEGNLSFSFFLQVMDRLHEAGIGVVFCTPTAAPPVWLTAGHPERCFVNQDGVVMGHGARQHACYDDPTVRSACLRLVRNLAVAIGRHPGLLAWQIDNELKCHVAEDFNPASERAWHAWLLRRYGTVEALNDAWGTETWSERYQRFQQVPTPRATPFLHNPSLSTAYRLFSRESIALFMDAQAALIRELSTAPITHNLHPGFAVHLERMCQNLDFISYDDYPSADRWSRWVFLADLFRPAKPGRPIWLMETSVSHNGWLGNNGEISHPRGFLAAEAVLNYGLGAEAVCYWLWRQPRAGCELPHSAVFSAWFKPSIGHGAVLGVERARRILEQHLQGATPAPAEIGLTWSDRSRAMLQTEALGSGRGHTVDYAAIMATWHRLVLEGGWHRELRFEEAPLEGLRLLFTPAMLAVTESYLQRVESWVRAGGIWICGPLTGARTAEHTVPIDAALGAVEALAGVETVFALPVQGTGSEAEAFGLKAPLAGWCSALRPALPDTRVRGRVITGLSEEPLAWLTERPLGHGLVVVIAAEPSGEAGYSLLQALVAAYATQAGVAPPWEVTPGTVVCPWITHGGRKLHVVVNMDGRGGDFRAYTALRDLGAGGVILPAGPVSLEPFAYKVLAE